MAHSNPVLNRPLKEHAFICETRMIQHAERDLQEAQRLLGPSVKHHLCEEGTIYEPLIEKRSPTRLKLIIQKS